MNFPTAFEAPVAIQIGEETVLVPRMTLRDWANYAAILNAERQKIALAELSPIDRFKAVTVFPVASVDFAEVSKAIGTPAGVMHIVTTCLAKAKVSKERIDQVLDATPPAVLEVLAYELAAITEPKAPVKSPAPDGANKDATFADERKGIDPLPGPANGLNA